jgi:glutamate dehydrogenase
MGGNDADINAAGATGTDRAPRPDAVAEQVADRLDPQLRTVGAALAETVIRRHPHGLPVDPDVRARVVAEGARLVVERAPGELAVHAYNPDASGSGTVVALVVEDAPFLMSSVAVELERLGLSMANHAYPEFGVLRDDHGAVHDLRPARGAQDRQSWIHVELRERLDAARRRTVADRLRRVVDDVRRATGDFAQMRARTVQLAEALDAHAAEAADFARWLHDDHFVFLGAADYRIADDHATPVAGSELGLLRGDDRHDHRDGLPLRIPVRRRMPPLTVSLTHQRSTVYRDERMVDIVAQVGVHGDRQLRRLVGLFAKKATAEPVTTIPLLRQWTEQVIEAEDIVPNSHDERMLRSALEALPKDALFTADVDRLTDVFTTLVRDEPDVIRVVAWPHEPSAAVVVVVALPRDRFDESVRERIDAVVAARLGAEPVEPFIGFHEHEALATYVLGVDDPAARIAETDIAGGMGGDIREICRTWAEQVLRAATTDEQRIAVRRWVDRMPASYRDITDPEAAVLDCLALDALVEGDGDARMRVVRTATSWDPDTPLPPLRCKLYRRGPAVELSRFVPILESLGLVVVESVPHVLHPASAPGDDGDEPSLRIHVYGVRLRVDTGFDVERDGARLAEAAQAIWAGRAESDSLNRLVLLAGLHWRDVAVLRAYRQFRRQVGTTFTAQYQSDALCEYPDIAAGLIDYFVARFGPELDDAARQADVAREQVLHRLDEVARLDQDRILRGYLSLMDATVRTNRYRSPVPDHLSLKFASERIPDLPRPAPHREIFVYSPQSEGVHLRGGPVARGGLRWSDRREDFRTEVLDLMKAQMVKNAVIVPTGSKGGFVLKRGVAPDDLRDEVRRQYETFVRGLFDVTDNLVDGEIEHPDRVRCHDDADAYLVVAADRGTAALSDVANRISAEYGFWLGDAFASGGSSGYDHKAMGITARGAWVAVREHFRELGIDIQHEPVRVVGIGDVFGNGMLQSAAIKLVAAFDHRDVLVDPDPDPAESHAERRRLFEQPGSTWQDYDRDALSAGGGVWSRSAKRIELTDEVRALIRTERDHLTPPELIRALLRAPVDLLFAGGIGTFVKASSERDADVADRANDAIRVDADELGARVVGEGGNLAVTQRGRVQYARRGGRINLDAIDNAGGVATSDREVNLKILLHQAQREHRLDPDDRDDVLAEVADDVARKVLADVRAQARLVSQETLHSPADLESYEQLMVDLESSGRLDRDVEALPGADEIARREQAGGGLTRPELGLLVGYAKADLAARLRGTDLTAEPTLRVLLEDYFPALVAERFADLLPRHQLSDELVATLLANDLVNNLGTTVVSRTVHQLGCAVEQVAGAYWLARQVSGAADDWSAIAELDTLDPAVQYALKEPVDRLVDTYLRVYAARHLPDDVGAVIERDRAAFVLLEDVWPSDPPPGVAGRRRELVSDAADRGVDEELAWRLVRRPDLAFVPDIAAVAADRDRPVAQVADAFIQIGRELPLEQLQDAVARTRPEGRWQQWERTTLLDELHAIRRMAAGQALDRYPEVDGDVAVRRLLAHRTLQLERVWTLLAMIGDQDEPPGLAQASVTVSALRAVLG